MKFHANENNPQDEAIVGDEVAGKNEQEVLPNSAPIESNNYGKKFSARIYKFFSLFMFFVYYLNCTYRIIVNSVTYYQGLGIKSIPDWWVYTIDAANWGDIFRNIFDWYAITLLVFLVLYFIVFLVTFIRYSPKNKKTFKFFKKGFVMARRLIKLISVGLTLTVLVNSAKFATLGDRFMFVVSLLAIIFTIMQIIVSVFVWIWGRKLNRSVKRYVGNVMSSYIATARVRPDSSAGKRKTVGDKLGNVKDRFLRTVEAMTLTKEEAIQRDAEFEEYVVENNDDTERFENDYHPETIETSKDSKGKRLKRSKLLNTKKVKKVTPKKTKTDKK